AITSPSLDSFKTRRLYSGSERLPFAASRSFAFAANIDAAPFRRAAAIPRRIAVRWSPEALDSERKDAFAALACRRTGESVLISTSVMAIGNKGYVISRHKRIVILCRSEPRDLVRVPADQLRRIIA